MRDVYLGLGSNLGDKCANIHRAVELLGEVSQVHQVSSLFKTEPVGNLDQDWFLNCAVEIETALEPRQLLAAALAIEKKLKRVRAIKNGPTFSSTGTAWSTKAASRSRIRCSISGCLFLLRWRRFVPASCTPF